MCIRDRFCYQLGYLRKGKERLNASLNTLRPALTQYNQLAKGIRDKTKERRSLLSEKKALSAVHVFRHRELAAKIAALTEDLEELRSEKNLLLASLAYSEEDAADKFPKDIAAKMCIRDRNWCVQKGSSYIKPSVMYCNLNNFNLYYQLYYFFSSESISTIFSSKKSFSNKVIGCCFSALSKSAGSSFFRIFLSIVPRTLRMFRSL